MSTLARPPVPTVGGTSGITTACNGPLAMLVAADAAVRYTHSLG